MKLGSHPNIIETHEFLEKEKLSTYKDNSVKKVQTVNAIVMELG